VAVESTIDIKLWKGMALLLHGLWLIDHRRSLYNDLWLWGVDRILLNRWLTLMHRRIAVLLRLAKCSLCDGAYDQAC
jgi:hypothetical protein